MIQDRYFEEDPSPVFLPKFQEKLTQFYTKEHVLKNCLLMKVPEVGLEYKYNKNIKTWEMF